MQLFLQIHAKKLLTILLILCLGSWSVVATILALNNKPIVKLMRVSGDEVSEILEETKEVTELLKRNFFRAYVGYCYNYDALSFKANMRNCSDLMSADLWASKSEELGRAAKSLQEENHSFLTYIVGSEKLSDGTFQLKVHTTKMYSGSRLDLNVQINLTIMKLAKSLENPWGFEVQSVKETTL